jgi:glycosyltransferase involved in cell wall biosynthesis
MPVGKIIVVNDGSTDTGPDIVAGMAEKDKRIFLLSGPNQGLSAARNKGVRASSAELVAFLDADDAWEPEKIAQEVSAVVNNPLCAFVHTQARAMDTTGQLLRAAAS